MSKKLMNAFLCGVAILSVSVFTSCKDDSDGLDAKVRVLQDQIAQIEETLKNALVTGVSITNVSTNPAGNTVLTFNKEINGSSTLEIAAGGSDVSVEIKDGVAVITIGGQSYPIPLGAAINSLQYWPEFSDGIVELGNAGANAFFLASPIPENLGLATFNVLVGEIPDRTRASVAAEMIVVNGTATVENGLVKVPLKGIQVEKSKTYRAALEMTIGGTTITSDLFSVEVSGDFSFVSEVIDPAVKPTAAMAATGPVDGAYTFTMDGATLLDPLNFNSLFEGVPAGATFRAASAAKQPEGDARNKQSILAGSLKADGAFAWSARPGTVFGDTGFLVEIVKDMVVVGKAYVKVTDPLAGIDWTGGLTGNGEAEYGARWKGLNVGVNEIDLQASFFSVGNDGDNSADWEILHGDARGGFFEKWPNFTVNFGNETLIFNNGEKLEVISEIADKFTVHSAGLYWFNRGFVIRVPEEANGADEVWPNFTGLKDGKEEQAGPGWTALDAWGGDGAEYSTTYNMPQGIQYGVTVTKDGVLKTTDAYGAYCLRLAVGARFEYVYGNARLGFGDHFSMIFFNRRWHPADAYMPAEFVKQ